MVPIFGERNARLGFRQPGDVRLPREDHRRVRDRGKRLEGCPTLGAAPGMELLKPPGGPRGGERLALEKAREDPDLGREMRRLLGRPRKRT
jgi:hypothetical protein